MVYLEAAIQGFSLKKSLNFRYSWEIPVGRRGGRLHAVYLPFWWKWATSWVFLKYFAFFIIYFVNGCFWGTALGGCFIILSTFFILMLHGRKVFWRALFAGGFLINIVYCIRCLFKINSALPF